MSDLQQPDEHDHRSDNYKRVDNVNTRDPIGSNKIMTHVSFMFNSIQASISHVYFLTNYYYYYFINNVKARDLIGSKYQKIDN